MAIVTKDPVRGMTVDPKAGVRRGQTDPEPVKAAVSTGMIYTCPMHPQIRQMGPGNCPICGMTLEPVKATLYRSQIGLNRIRPWRTVAG